VKKKIVCVFALLLIAAVTVVAYYEIHFDTDEVVTVNISEEKLLREMPKVVLTEADYALGERIFADPEVMAAMETDESTEFTAEKAEELFGDDLPDGAASLGIGVSQDSVSCGYYLENEKQRVIMTFFQDDLRGPYKSVTAYHGLDGTRTTIYQNRSGKIQKIKLQHRWFAYLRDRVWEET
jgi:hypothetical protein